jgi:hypothetical protein
LRHIGIEDGLVIGLKRLRWPALGNIVVEELRQLDEAIERARVTAQRLFTQHHEGTFLVDFFRVRPPSFTLIGVLSVRLTSVMRLRTPLRRPAGLPDWPARNRLCSGGLP